MKKKILFIVFTLCLFKLSVNAQLPKIDTVAVSILDRMSAVLGELNSCSVTVKSNYDINSKQFGLIKHSDEELLYLHGPDKLLVKADGDKGNHTLLYNGKKFTIYSLDKNQYGEIDTKSTLLDMIDSVNKVYGIEFPASDFFYPGFVDDIISESKTLAFLGMTRVNDKDCYHIAGTAKDKTFQFWISDDAYYLPLKMVIVYTNKQNNPQYEATLTNWQINPDLPAAIFEFVAPPNAKKIKLIPVSTKK